MNLRYMSIVWRRIRERAREVSSIISRDLGVPVHDDLVILAVLEHFKADYLAAAIKPRVKKMIEEMYSEGS